MKKYLLLLSFVAITVLIICVPSSEVQAEPIVTIKVIGIHPGDVLELAVGESYTFEVHVKSNEPFVIATAMSDQYYPGRGVYWHESDRVAQDTSAVLYLTMTGKASTTDLYAVCDWPEPGDCWPEGVAPVSIVVGVRYMGGMVVSERFPFAVVVVE